MWEEKWRRRGQDITGGRVADIKLNQYDITRECAITRDG